MQQNITFYYKVILFYSFLRFIYMLLVKSKIVVSKKKILVVLNSSVAVVGLCVLQNTVWTNTSVKYSFKRFSFMIAFHNFLTKQTAFLLKF